MSRTSDKILDLNLYIIIRHFENIQIGCVIEHKFFISLSSTKKMKRSVSTCMRLRNVIKLANKNSHKNQNCSTRGFYSG